MGKLIKDWYKHGERAWKITFYTSQTISILLIVISFLLPPMGIIDSSIFAAVGELAFFPTLFSFYSIIRSGRNATITKGDTSLNVHAQAPETV